MSDASTPTPTEPVPGWRTFRSDQGHFWATRECPYDKAVEGHAWRTVEADTLPELRRAIAEQEFRADEAARA